MIHPVLTALGLGGAESGTDLGDGAWSTTTDAGVIEPVNPADGSVLARVQAACRDDYETIVERAQAAFRV
ncbi:MAG: aldehyde dehydrogenase family protein, partial [Luteimonas sp.]